MAFPDAWFRTLITAANEAAAVPLSGTTSLLDAVYTNMSLRPGEAGQTIRIPIPTTASFTDRKNQGLNVSGLNADTIEVLLQEQPSYAYRVTDFESINTMPVAEIQRVYLDPMYIAAGTYLNGKIAALFQNASGYFDEYTPVPHETNNTLTEGQIAAAWEQLTNALVPTNDAANMFFAAHSTVFGNMLKDTNLNQSQTAGVDAAVAARQRATILPQRNATVLYDQQMPIRNISSVDKYVTAYFHRYAIALAAVPLPSPNSQGIAVEYLNYKGIPIRAMMSYVHKDLCWYVSYDFAFGLKILRKKLGTLIYSNKV